MELVYGTRNKAKLETTRRCLSILKPEYDIDIISLNELDCDFPDIPENGRDPLDTIIRLKIDKTERSVF